MKYPTPVEFAAAPARAGLTPQQRLHASYVVDEAGCWRWTKALTSSGYGHFHYRGNYYQAHRLMYTLLRGPVLTSAMDHLCRNRACVNPDHLEPVSHRENTRRGDGTRLTPDAIRRIHSLAAQGLSRRAIGRRLKVDHSTVSRVLSGQRWPEYAPVKEAEEEAA
jgi:hypothetical protein